MFKIIKPSETKVVIRPDSIAETKKNGIIIPETAQNVPISGEIVSAHPSVSELAPGNRVIFPKNVGWAFKDDTGNYLIMNESDILAVIL